MPDEETITALNQRHNDICAELEREDLTTAEFRAKLDELFDVDGQLADMNIGALGTKDEQTLSDIADAKMCARFSSSL